MKKTRETSQKSILTTDEEWASQKVYDSPLWRQEIQTSFSHPHRSLLVEKISGYTPFSRILEIGCGYGSNLYLLSKKFPSVEFVGMDINPNAVRHGQEFFHEERCTNVNLEVGKAQDLKKYPDHSFDLIFTDAILMYVKPDEILSVLTEMMRVGKIIILNEWYPFNKFMAISTDTYYCFKRKYETMKFSDEQSSLLRCLFAPKSIAYGVYTGHWTRDYQALIKEVNPSSKIAITKITKNYWNDKKWSKWGAIIEVDTR